VGCGTGSLIVSLAKVFRETAGLDPDEAMLDAARPEDMSRSLISDNFKHA